MQSWAALRVIFATVLIATCESSDCSDAQECSYYYMYDMLENALLNYSNNTYYLQQAFFPISGESPTSVDFEVTINTSFSGGSGSLFDGECSYQYRWAPSNDRFRRKIYLRSIFVFEPIYSIRLGGIYLEYYNYMHPDAYVHIELRLEELPCRNTTCADYGYTLWSASLYG